MRVLKSHVRAKLREADGESNQLDVTKGNCVFIYFFLFSDVFVSFVDVLNSFFGKAKNELEWSQRNPFVFPGL